MRSNMCANGNCENNNTFDNEHHARTTVLCVGGGVGFKITEFNKALHYTYV